MNALLSRFTRRYFPRYVPASDQQGRRFHYPALEQKALDNARLFASREDQLRFFAPQVAHGVVAEVGVMFGDLSEFIVQTMAPDTLVAIDRFDAHFIRWSGVNLRRKHSRR
jgi:hypothetical protein